MNNLNVNKMQIVFNIINMKTIILGSDQNTEKNINFYNDNYSYNELFEIQNELINHYNQALKNTPKK